MNEKVMNLFFKGILSTYSIRDLQSKGVLRIPEMASAEKSDIDLFAPLSEAIRSSSLLMQRNYRLLYVLENLIRDFINTRLTELYADKWFEQKTTTGMKEKIENRKKDEEKNNWHIGRNSHPIYYLDFGDLGLLIQNNWADFKDFFENQAWVISRMQEAERTRNVIAHTNYLAAEEGQRLEMYLRDWIMQIG